MHYSNLWVKHQALIKRAVIIALIGFTGYFLFYTVRGIDWELFSDAKPSHYIYILAITIINTVLYSWLILILVNGSGFKTTLQQAYLILTASLTANYVTPVKVGIPLRIYLYKTYMDVPSSTGTALVTIEAFLGILIPSMIAIIGTVLLFPTLGVFIPLLLFMVFTVGAILGITLPFERISNFVKKRPFLSKFSLLFHFIHRVQLSLKAVPFTVLIAVFSIDLVMISLQAVRLYFVLLIFGFNIPFASLLAASTIALTAGNISMIPMGLGVRDASFTFLLIQLGVTNEVALSVTVIQRLFSPGWPLLLGLISTNILGISEFIKQMPKETQIDSTEVL